MSRLCKLALNSITSVLIRARQGNFPTAEEGTIRSQRPRRERCGHKSGNARSRQQLEEETEFILPWGLSRGSSDLALRLLAPENKFLLF